MDPALIIALARLGAKLGMNLFALLQSEGVTFTDDELRAARAETQAAVDDWGSLAPGGE